MPIKGKGRYNPAMMEHLQRMVQLAHDTGNPKDFAIAVDGTKVISRTSDPAQFHNYEEFINAHTESMEVMLYKGASNNSDKYIYTFDKDDAASKGEALSGIEIDNRIKDGIAKEKQEWEKVKLEDRNKELEEEVKELEENNEKLETIIADMKAKESPLKGVFGDFGSIMVESFIRRNPQLISSIPGGAALAGILEEDNRRLQQGQIAPSEPETEVSFTAKEAKEDDKEAKEAVGFSRYLRTHFKGMAFSRLMEIIDLLIAKQGSMEAIINQLKQTEKEEESNAVQL